MKVELTSLIPPRSMLLESKPIPVFVPQVLFLEPRDSAQTITDMLVRRVCHCHTCQWHCFSPSFYHHCQGLGYGLSLTPSAHPNFPTTGPCMKDGLEAIAVVYMRSRGGWDQSGGNGDQ